MCVRSLDKMKHKYQPVALAEPTDTVARAYVTYGNVDTLCACLTHRQGASLAGIVTMVGKTAIHTALLMPYCNLELVYIRRMMYITRRM